MHHFFAVYRYAAFIQVHTERVGVQRVIAGFGRCNQKLGRHAAHAGTGGAEHMALNQVNIIGVLSRGAECAHAGGAAANHYHIGLDFFHGFSFRAKPFQTACLCLLWLH